MKIMLDYRMVPEEEIQTRIPGARPYCKREKEILGGYEGR